MDQHTCGNFAPDRCQTDADQRLHPQCLNRRNIDLDIVACREQGPLRCDVRKILCSSDDTALQREPSQAHGILLGRYNYLQATSIKERRMCDG